MTEPKDLTIAQLREELEDAKLPSNGLKATLVKRLTEHESKGKKRKPTDDEEEDEEEEEEDKPAKRPKREVKKPTKAAGKKAAAKPKAKRASKKKEESEDEEEEEEEEESEEEKTTKKRGGKKAAAAKPSAKKAKGKEKDVEVAKKAAEETSYKTEVDWEWEGTLMHHEMPDVKPSEKLACFDYDGCLAKTSLFRHGPDAWSVRHDSVPERLKELHDKGYKLIIMSNQSDIGKAAPANKAKKIAEKSSRLLGFTRAVDLPFQILVATSKTKDANDLYRKPAVGMWTFATKHNGGVTPDLAKSFFVGDAAGRTKDHGDTDIHSNNSSSPPSKFAEKAGLKFFTEDEFFEKSGEYEA